MDHLFFLACDGDEPAGPAPTTIQEAVDQVANPYIARKKNVGVIIGVIKNGEKTIHSYGEKTIGSGEKLTAQSIFEIASLTKTFTATALADMHLKGVVNLDDPIEKYLPVSVRVPSRNGKKITLRHLANHTSGFPRQPTNMDDDAYNPYKNYTQEMMYAFLNNHKLERDPGSKAAYSNLGYELLGHIISLVNNSTYEQVITEKIAQSLGLQNTFVILTAAREPNKAQGHTGRNKAESWSGYMQNITQGTGGLSSNMNDMLIFLDANMKLNNTALQQAMTLAQQRSTDISGEFGQNGIGLGWSLSTTDDSQNIIWKNGLNGAYSAFIGFNKATQTGVVLLYNSSLNPDFYQTEMGFELLKKLNQF